MLEPTEPTESSTGSELNTPSDTLPPRRRRRAASRPAGPPAAATETQPAEVVEPAIPPADAEKLDQEQADLEAETAEAEEAAEVEGPEGLPLVEDALRTNDTRLLTAAVGPYAARHLDAHQWRHAVLKCLFTGVPVDAVADLDHRAEGDTELARMLTDYAAERTAAGRTVPADLHRVLTLTDPPATPSAPAADHG
ncbi:EboA domain-containing protein [Streptomyces nigra]